MGKELRLSVHQLVDFLLRTGDIDNRYFNRSTMSEGSRLHAVFQEEQSSEYIPEYPLKRTFTMDGVDITLEGRADGIIKKKNKEFIVDEIKTTTMDLDIFIQENQDWHLGQAKCYAYMFMLEQKLPSIGVRLTYIRQGEEKERRFLHYYFLEAELQQYVYSLLEDYLDFYSIIFRSNEQRDASIKTLKFPFDKYRKGQKELTKYSYAVAKNGGRLFVEAPTGIGKTMSTIFPFIKAIEFDDKAKIFYLTAKTSGKELAYNAIELLKLHDLHLNDIVITAKDKICFCPGKECNPEQCPFAKGYYNKIVSIIRYALLNYSTFDYQTIINLATDNSVCPFELELDLSLFCDVIICDYNYMFDPISYMKRYFDEDASSYLALVDEAHNLVDRSRSIYSASINYETFLEAKKSMRHVRQLKIKRQFTKINNRFIDIIDNYEDGYQPLLDLADDDLRVFQSFVDAYQDISKDEHDSITSELTEFYLEVNRFLKIYEFYNQRFLAYYYVDGNKTYIRLFCMDASGFLKAMLNRIKGAVLFSATLSPLPYYLDSLGGDSSTDPSLILPSPFPKKNFKLMVAPKVSIRYKDRDTSYREVANYIHHFIKNKVGNYFIYCPSYEYIDTLMHYLDFPDDINVYRQEKDMTEREKEEFLTYFQTSPEKTTLGFLVVGGAFGEGIDLVSDRLIGAIIIGIGMPRINFESDQIMNYYKNEEKPGYEYAYLNPGMNKVMQAVGRVIRSENDRGAVLLIEERYMNRAYQDLFKNEWSHYEVVMSPEEVSKKLEKFFKDQ